MASSVLLCGTTKQLNLAKQPFYFEHARVATAFFFLFFAAPTITSPIKVQVDKDGTAIFTVVASGEKLTYQWFGPDRKDLSDIPGKISGATTPVLKIFDVQLDDHDVENYQVIVSNANGGSVISYAARLANSKELLMNEM